MYFALVNYSVLRYYLHRSVLIVFFFNDTATTEIYTLSLHDALPICGAGGAWSALGGYYDAWAGNRGTRLAIIGGDRKSTRLNSSHSQISYAVFCLKKKKKNLMDTADYYLFEHNDLLHTKPYHSIIHS